MSTKEKFSIEANLRSETGKADSRRIRRQGLVPAIIYGGKSEPVKLLLDHNKIFHHLENEAFYSHILTIKAGGKEEMVILRDLQRHPSKDNIMHLDFFRITADEKITVRVPIHFLNPEACIGVKTQGGIVSHLLNELEISCYPKDLPEFIEVDIIDLELGSILHLSDIKIAKELEIVSLTHGDTPVDQAMVSVIKPKVIQEEEDIVPEEGAAETEGAEEGDKQEDSDSDKS